MHCSEHRSEDYANSANDNIRNAQERVLPTDDGSRRDEDFLCTTVKMYGEIYRGLALVI